MCGKSKNLWLIILLTLSLSVPAYFSSSAAGGSIQPAEQKTTITMPIRQWNELKQELTAQENDLTQLRIKLKMLKGNSTEQIKQLDELSRQLAQTKQSLMSAQKSLTECKNELETSRQSLEILKVKIRKLEHQQTVTRRQRDVYATLFAVSVGAAIARR